MLLIYNYNIRLILRCLFLFILFYDYIYCLSVYKRKKIVVHGDLMIGALLPVHEQPSYDNNEDHENGSRRKCGIIRDQYGKRLNLCFILFFFIIYVYELHMK